MVTKCLTFSVEEKFEDIICKIGAFNEGKELTFTKVKAPRPIDTGSIPLEIEPNLNTIAVYFIC